VYRFSISPTSTHVVYIADQNVYGKRELFAVELQKETLCFPIKGSNNKVAVICL